MGELSAGEIEEIWGNICSNATLYTMNLKLDSAYHKKLVPN
jgi:hypothetical protein